MRKPVMLAVLACALGCSQPAEKAREGTGAASVQVNARTEAYDLTTVTIEIQPANIVAELTYTPASASFGGSIQVPAGSQTFTARAYVGATLVGASEPLTVTMVASRTTLIHLVILDNSGPAPQPDHGPIITSFTVSNAAPVVGDSLTLTATAVDVDGDPITYLWTQSAECGGSFSAPTSPSTTWTAALIGPCTLTVTATSKALTDARSVALVVASNQATAQVDGFFVSQPTVSAITVTNRINFSDTCTGQRGSNNGNCIDYLDKPKSLLPGRTYEVTVRAWLGTGRPSQYEIMLTDDCTGTLPPGMGGSSRSGEMLEAMFNWTAPSTSRLCTLRATVQNFSLVDEFSTVAFVTEPASCLDDPYENNNSDVRAMEVPLSGGTGQFELPGVVTNDDDWFDLTTYDDLPSVTVTTSPQVPVVMDAFDFTDGTLASTPFASGIEGVSLGRVDGSNSPVSKHVKLRVRPDPNATGCATPYSMFITVQ